MILSGRFSWSEATGEVFRVALQNREVVSEEKEKQIETDLIIPLLYMISSPLTGSAWPMSNEARRVTLSFDELVVTIVLVATHQHLQQMRKCLSEAPPAREKFILFRKIKKIEKRRGLYNIGNIARPPPDEAMYLWMA